ncbi:hypothetical protein Pmar_PMAR023985 [Perkinsus marinus ATCC 50983]|uniref:Uncharacterized protein n=1 Tax=Perkinsus marinus (strain ATCC 50983 / TXsc) TaxID=423536 RepID=C5L351_PERM5|nr:hypothetical protein Pmar_PMAR023985 [Perkinsus marinus ATCC 50983]EER08846.1 hypothetical protein Pmar_PMAR023985 [Perkinsus marinus ATCC 50983]|eukprot:XP_002777030.1 hypothetical protein Pmar_PMAR023985 [Perkinsus marinus ATCC 50983]
MLPAKAKIIPELSADLDYSLFCCDNDDACSSGDESDPIRIQESSWIEEAEALAGQEIGVDLSSFILEGN